LTAPPRSVTSAPLRIYAPLTTQRADDGLLGRKPDTVHNRRAARHRRFAAAMMRMFRPVTGRYDLARAGDSENGVIQFENVGLRYGLGPEILRDLTFHIAPRSFQFLSGPSGAGKSSLLRLLFLTLKPTRGLITLFDHDTATLSADSLAVLRRRIGVVFQDFRLLDHLSTFDNVALPLRVIGRQEESYYEEVAELLGWVGLGEHMWSLPPVLSGGEKQRAAIARAVIARPQLLLADEPTGNVDPQLAQRLLRLFIELNKSGTSVVIATHDIALMDQYDARRLVLHDGYIHVYD
jgi:cell division transport system ATP-binding protein